MHEMNTKYGNIFCWKASSEETNWKVILRHLRKAGCEDMKRNGLAKNRVQ
jgi:hypothetical protein